MDRTIRHGCQVRRLPFPFSNQFKFRGANVLVTYYFISALLSYSYARTTMNGMVLTQRWNRRRWRGVGWRRRRGLVMLLKLWQVGGRVGWRMVMSGGTRTLCFLFNIISTYMTHTILYHSHTGCWLMVNPQLNSSSSSAVTEAHCRRPQI
jgi:hypothetical protein